MTKSIYAHGAACICEWPGGCGGLGITQCEGCGGDQCVCLCGGQAPCAGCFDCASLDDEDPWAEIFPASACMVVSAFDDPPGLAREENDADARDQAAREDGDA